MKIEESRQQQKLQVICLGNVQQIFNGTRISVVMCLVEKFTKTLPIFITGKKKKKKNKKKKKQTNRQEYKPQDTPKLFIGMKH